MAKILLGNICERTLGDIYEIYFKVQNVGEHVMVLIPALHHLHTITLPKVRWFEPGNFWVSVLSKADCFKLIEL